MNLILPTRTLLCLLFALCISPDFLAAQETDADRKPFYHGVASGDPLTDRVIIWTRVTPEIEAPVEVGWRMATDPGLVNVVREGRYTTGAHRDYTVKVDVDGLEAGETYYYGFSALGGASIVGKTKTAPDGDVDQLKFAVVSCANLQHGYFNAYGRIGDRTDLDAVIHLGDYIYEISASGDDFYGAESLREKGERLHIPDREILTLEDYRARYSQYRMDPDMINVHQQHAFVLIWDDHESANDAYEEGAENHQPDEGEWSDRKAIARQVYDEWMPVRSDLTEFPLYRTVRYGNLVDLIMLDTRLEGRQVQLNDVTDTSLYAPDRTILGPVQKDWFLNELSASEAQWKVVGNQVIFSEFNVWWAADPGNPALGTPEALESVFLDIWDGYPAERDQIIHHIAGTETDNPIDNVIILTGDFHSSFAYDVALRPAPLSGSDPSIAAAGVAPVPVIPTYDPASGAGSVAVEFATPSVTSANFDENLPPQVAAGFEFQINNPLPDAAGALAGLNPNPHMRYTDLDRHGYFLLDLDSERAQADWYFVNDILAPSSNESFDSGWFTAEGENRLQEAEGPSAPKTIQDERAPDAPQPATPLLSASLTSEGLPLLSWRDGVAETLYLLERDAGNGMFEFLVELEKDVDTYIDDTGVAGNSYRIKAVNAVFESPFSPAVTVDGPDSAAFVLHDAESDTAVESMKQGYVIDTRVAPAGLSISVEFRDVTPARVGFYLNDAAVRSESVAPFTLGGDVSGDIFPVDELHRPGLYVLQAVAYAGSGDILAESKLLFQVINNDLYISDFHLVDAANDTEVGVLPKYEAFIEPALYPGGLSIRAVAGDETASVVFSVAGQEDQVERVAPFALGGDEAGNYTPVDFLEQPGAYIVYATPYDNVQASGEAGVPLKINMIVAGMPSVAGFEKNQLEATSGNEVPATVSLAGNYPNPFNPVTTIRFGLPEEAHARIVLYDVLGRVVDVIADGEYAAGWHSVTVDGSQLASGIYIYQLETKNNVQIGKMILQK